MGQSWQRTLAGLKPVLCHSARRFDVLGTALKRLDGDTKLGVCGTTWTHADERCWSWNVFSVVEYFQWKLHWQRKIEQERETMTDTEKQKEQNGRETKKDGEKEFLG